MSRRLWPALVAGILVSFLTVACSSDEPEVELKMAPVSQLPAELQSAPTNVQEAYRFAIVNKDLLEQIPCFCGCNAVGHTSNYECYVAADNGPGVVLQYDNHALG